MIRRITLILLSFFYIINAQIALPTFQGVQKPHTAEASSLYDFTTHTFTNCGATGREGPTLANCTSTYSDSWTDNTDYFNIQTQGIQEWTVPSNGTYTVEVWGAQGGDVSSGLGGKGARMRGDFALTSGTVIYIVVGQEGLSQNNNNCNGGGGGGGTFFYKSGETNPLIVAGGGGGGHRYVSSTATNGVDGSTTSDAVTNSEIDGSPGTDGNGGDAGSCGSGWPGAGGAGWISNGGNTCNWSSNLTYGGSTKYDFRGGASNPSTTQGSQGQDGSFGGGGAAFHGAGGGGGYSGGGGGGSCSVSNDPAGGGGGSYNSGSNQSNSSGVWETHGKVIITKN